MGAIPAVHTWIAGEVDKAANLNLGSTAITWQQGGYPLTVLRQTVQQSIPNATWTALAFDTEPIDSDATHSGSGSRITPLTPTWWQFECDVAFASNATGVRGIRLVKNGTILYGRVFLPPATGFSTGLHYSTEIDVNGTTDYVEVQAYQSSGGALLTGGSTEDPARFTARWIRS